MRLAIFLASCQPAPTGNLPSSSPRASGVATPTATLPPNQSSAPLVVTISATGVFSTVSLWSGTSLVGNVQACNRSAIAASCHPYQVTYLPCVSTSNTRAYFVDGDTTVRYLAPGSTTSSNCGANGCTFGTNGDVTGVPGGPERASAFSVSPDDQRIAVSVFDFRSTPGGYVPMSVRLYVEDLIGSGNHVELFSSTNSWVWPVGWHNGKLVVAAGSPTKPIDGPYGGVTEFHLVDPVTGDRLQALGSASCPVVPALLSPAGTVCVAADGSLRSQYWSGPNVTFAPNYRALGGGAMLSLDGTKVAVCCATNHALDYLEVIDTPALGGAVKSVGKTPGYLSGGGWIDATHLSYRALGSDNLLWVDTTSPVGPTTIPIVGQLAGRVPGGL